MRRCFASELARMRERAKVRGRLPLLASASFGVVLFHNLSSIYPQIGSDVCGAQRATRNALPPTPDTTSHLCVLTSHTSRVGRYNTYVCSVLTSHTRTSVPSGDTELARSGGV